MRAFITSVLILLLTGCVGYIGKVPSTMTSPADDNVIMVYVEQTPSESVAYCEGVGWAWGQAAVARCVEGGPISEIFGNVLKHTVTAVKTIFAPISNLSPFGKKSPDTDGD